MSKKNKIHKIRVYQKGKGGKWYYEFAVGDHREHRAAKGATNEEEAYEFALNRKSLIFKGKMDHEDTKINIRLNKLTDYFLEYSELNKNSYKNDKYYIKNFKEFMGNPYIKDIKRSDIEKFRAHRLGKVAASSVNREMNSIKKMFSLAVDEEWINYSPCLKIKKLRVEPKKRGTFTRQQKNEMFKQADDWFRVFMMCLLQTGARLSEIRLLPVHCVEIKKKYITVLKTKSGVPRDIPISNELAEELRKIIESHNEYYVFTNPNTKKPYVDLRKALEKSKKNIKDLANITFHWFRHTAATTMIENGVDIVIVQDILGHADISTTAIYLHKNKKRKEKAAKILSRF